MVYNATEVAKYVVNFSSQSGDRITQLKLQKILYYIQGTYLALKGCPAFSDEIMAWKLGPAVHSVYSAYKQYDDQPIPPSDSDVNMEPEDQLFIAEIYKKFRGFTAAQLVDKTHNEAPWRDTTTNDVISIDSIRDFFANVVFNDDDLLSDKPIVTELPKEWYDPTENEEWRNYK